MFVGIHCEIHLSQVQCLLSYIVKGRKHSFLMAILYQIMTEKYIGIINKIIVYILVNNDKIYNMTLKKP